MSHGYIDISYTKAPTDADGTIRYIDPLTLEVLFLNEVVDNPSNTACEYKHHELPVLGVLPAAFSSNGTVLAGREICDTLLAEHIGHSGDDDPSMLFPIGADNYISNVLNDVISYVLYECDSVYVSYTSGLIRSVYGWNYVYGLFQSHRLRDRMVKSRESSLIHSLEDCVLALEELFNFLSFSVHISASMRLPLRITSKLYSSISVLLATSFPADSPMHIFLTSNACIPALAAWAEHINEGCKLWPVWPKPQQHASPLTPRVSTARSPHNVFFLMSSVAVVFLYLAMSSKQ